MVNKARLGLKQCVPQVTSHCHQPENLVADLHILAPGGTISGNVGVSPSLPPARHPMTNNSLPRDPLIRLLFSYTQMPVQVLSKKPSPMHDIGTAP